MKTFFSVCSGLGSIFQIFPLTLNQSRLETTTLLPSGLVYLLLCFLCKFFIHHLLRLYYVCLLLIMKRKNWCLWKIFCSVFTYSLLLWTLIVNCSRCQTLSPLINVWPTLTNVLHNELQQKVNKVILGEYFETEKPCLFYFCVDVARILKLAQY